MKHSSKLLFSVVIVCSLLSVIMCRELHQIPLLERLNLQGEDATTCWESLSELHSCTGEIVLFFINGETFLGPGCCDAVRTIQHHCWPSMLGSVGINEEEGDVLRGYCDASEDSSSTGTPP